MLLTGTLQADRLVRVTARAVGSWLRARLPLQLIPDAALVGFIDCTGESYADETYAWAGRAPIEHTLPARPGSPHQLLLRWGAKNDRRRGSVIVNGRLFEVERGGYQGYQWVALDLPADLMTEDAVTVRIEAGQPTGAPFIAEMRLRVAP